MLDSTDKLRQTLTANTVLIMDWLDLIDSSNELATISVISFIISLCLVLLISTRHTRTKLQFLDLNTP